MDGVAADVEVQTDFDRFLNKKSCTRGYNTPVPVKGTAKFSDKMIPYLVVCMAFPS